MISNCRPKALQRVSIKFHTSRQDTTPVPKLKVSYSGSAWHIWGLTFPGVRVSNSPVVLYRPRFDNGSS